VQWRADGGVHGFRELTKDQPEEQAQFAYRTNQMGQRSLISMGVQTVHTIPYHRDRYS